MFLDRFYFLKTHFFPEVWVKDCLGPGTVHFILFSNTEFGIDGIEKVFHQHEVCHFSSSRLSIVLWEHKYPSPHPSTEQSLSLNKP